MMQIVLALAALLMCGQAWAQGTVSVGQPTEPISSLPPIPSVLPTDILPLVRLGSPNVTYRGTMSQVFNNQTFNGATLNSPTFPTGFTVSNELVDVAAKGAKCDGSTNDSAAFTAAIAALPTGGIVRVPATGHSCVLTTGITLNSGVRLQGVSGAAWPNNYDSNVESNWTTFGSWIRCDDQTNACITVSGLGAAIEGINFWYTQPTPTGTNCGATCTFATDWTPTVYPYTISIPGGQNFNHFSNINIVGATNCIDLEGPASGVGSFFTYFDHLQLSCFNIGMKFNKVDNAIAVNDVKFLDLWYQAYNDVWGYMENNKIDMDMSYLSDPSFNAIQFYQSLAAIRINTGSVTSGLGTVTFGAQGLQFTNTVFNQVCQAIILGTGNPIVNGDFTNTTINIDPQTSVIANQCGQKTPAAFNLNSNNVDMSFTNINGFEAQQLFNVGGGASGGVHLSGRVRISYSAFAAGAAAIQVNANAFVDMPNGVNDIFPVSGAGAQCAGACRNWPVVPLGDIWITGGAGGVPRQELFLSTSAQGAFLTRWGLKEDSVPETGSMTGSNFGIDRYNDDGSFRDTPFQMPRTTGQGIFADGLAVTGGLMAMPVYTVAGLPTCNGTTNVNAMAVVTDANSPTFLGAVTGGSSTHTKVICNGTNWIAD